MKIKALLFSILLPLLLHAENYCIEFVESYESVIVDIKNSEENLDKLVILEHGWTIYGSKLDSDWLEVGLSVKVDIYALYDGYSKGHLLIELSNENEKTSQFTSVDPLLKDIWSDWGDFYTTVRSVKIEGNKAIVELDGFITEDPIHLFREIAKDWDKLPVWLKEGTLVRVHPFNSRSLTIWICLKDSSNENNKAFLQLDRT